MFLISGCGGGGGSDYAGITSSTPGAGTVSVSLAWNSPSTNEDGSQLTDLAGYKVYYGLQW